MPTELYENLQAPKRAVLAAIDTGAYDVEVSLAELRELAKTAGYPVVGEAVQKLQTPVAATFMGSGRLLELKDYMAAVEGELIIFDEELSPAQLRNIEELCDCPVLDRTMLILDIFAARAVSGEGKLQVELARLQYQLPRLAGQGVQLSRQGGGTGGTGARRGAGESKLEVDRRHIRRRIEALKAELEALSRRREQRRARRKKDGITTVAIVGYTNVGKSTLLNALTEAGVLAEDKLFATLDPTARSLALPDGRTVMLIDTVGLVRRLPHQLVEAFHSTLEEAANADLILSVCDITSPELLEQRAVTERLLEELGVEGTPVITVLNKCDAAAPSAAAEPYRGCVRISAKTGYGLPALLQSIAEALPPARIRCRLCLPYTEGGLLHRLEQQGQIFCREYTAEGVLLEADVEQRDWPLYRDYIKTEV